MQARHLTRQRIYCDKDAGAHVLKSRACEQTEAGEFEIEKPQLTNVPYYPIKDSFAYPSPADWNLSAKARNKIRKDLCSERKDTAGASAKFVETARLDGRYRHCRGRETGR